MWQVIRDRNNVQPGNYFSDVIHESLPDTRVAYYLEIRDYNANRDKSCAEQEQIRGLSARKTTSVVHAGQHQPKVHDGAVP